MELPLISNFHTPGRRVSLSGGAIRSNEILTPGQTVESFWRIKGVQPDDDWPEAGITCMKRIMNNKETSVKFFLFTI